MKPRVKALLRIEEEERRDVEQEIPEELNFSHTDIKVGDVLRYVIPETREKESRVKSRAGKKHGISQFWWNVETKDTGEEKSVKLLQFSQTMRFEAKLISR